MHGMCLVVGEKPELLLEKYADWATDQGGKFDWFEIGGRFKGYLKLKSPRPVGALKRLFGGRPITEVNQATKQEIDQAAIKANTPTAIIFEGEWLECPLTSEQSALEDWSRTFQTVFERIPSDVLLTVVDFHS